LKKHYLLIWPTYRRDWVKVFHDLKGSFDFTFLPAVFPKAPNYASDFSCRYWSEFENAKQLLNELNPDGIIFMSIESGLNMVLNHTAIKAGIPTFILQHGIYTNYKDYRFREKLWRTKSRAGNIQSEQLAQGFSSLKFISSSLSGIDKRLLPLIALYTKLQQRIGSYWTAKHLPLKLKKAVYYLCLSPYNTTIHKETDRIIEQQIKYIGSPELVNYLKKEEPLTVAPYYLHIDQALAENSLGEETVSKKELIDFYLKLSEFCENQKAQLYIKLHPESYGSTWLPKNENIVYLRHVESFNQYIQSALGCFGFYSTMVIPAIYWKPTILFRIQYSGLQEAIVKHQNVSVIDYWNFRSSDIFFAENNINQKKIEEEFILSKGVKESSLKEILLEY
jgi:hypothetical protein